MFSPEPTRARRREEDISSSPPQGQLTLRTVDLRYLRPIKNTLKPSSICKLVEIQMFDLDIFSPLSVINSNENIHGGYA